MTNINSKYRVADGTGYEKVYHFETNSNMVLMQDGRTLSEVYEGKKADSQNLTIFKTDGKYIVTNSVGLPTGLKASLPYLLKVETVEDVVWQTLYDHVGNNVYTRCLTELGFSNWSNGGKDIQDKVISLGDKIGNIEFDVAKHEEKIVDHQKKIDNIVKEMGEEVTAHNHDERYVKKDGGVYTGHFGMANGVSLVGNTTGGTSLSIAKMNSSNQIEIGNTQTQLNLLSSSDITLNGKEIITGGNLSKYSSNFGDVFSNKSNTFQGTQTINGKLKIKSNDGLSFERADGIPISTIAPDSSDLVMKLAGTEVFRLRSSDNALMANQKLILQGSDRVWLRMGMGNDQGLGFSGQAGSNQFSMYDWGKGKAVFTVNREDNCVDFTNSIRVQGRKLSIGYQPANATVGDICIV